MKVEAVKVSVIVSVYNDEKYLERCLQSLQEQTLKEFEVLCIDEGSSDGSVSILQKYAGEDRRFRVFQQNKGSVAAAKNFGIEHACGQYMLFPEPDSFFSPELLKKVCDKALHAQADIVVPGGMLFFVDTGDFESVHSPSDPVSWTKLYCREFIVKEGICYQDLPGSKGVFFLLAALGRATSIVRLEEGLIYHRAIHGSELQKKKTEDPTAFITEYLAAYRELRRRGIYEKVEKSFVNMAVRDFSCSLKAVKDNRDRKLICEKLLSPEVKAMGILRKPAEFYEQDEHITDVLGILKGYVFSERQRAVRKNTSLDTLVENKVEGTPLVSVVIPVYNVENYVQETLDSICGQSLKNIEIICVNDGSTDGSLSILQKNAAEDKRISVYSQTNKGLAVTRNKGLEKARGKYLYFMDSDDILESSALEILVARMEKVALDVLYFDGTSFSTDLADDDEEVKRFSSYYSRRNIYPDSCSGLELFRLMVEKKEFRSSACLQLIRRGYLCEEGLCFHAGILHEDNAFTFRCMAGAKRAGYCGLPLFKRRVRSDSIMTRKKTFHNAYGYFCCYQDILKWLNERELELKYYEAAEWMLGSMRHSTKWTYLGLDEAEKGMISGLSCTEQIMLRQLCE